MKLLVPERELESVRGPARTSGPLPTFREIGCGYRPGRSSLLSFIGHELVLLAIVFFPRYSGTIHLPHELTPPQPVAKNVLYLPVLGGGSEGSGHHGGAAGSPGKESTGLRARSRRGFAYPGPQPVVSNPPHATLGIQTILQPALINPPLLHTYVPLPDIVRAPTILPAAPQSVLSVKQGNLSLRPVPENPVQAPKLTLPSSAASAIPNLVAKDSASASRSVRLAVPRAPELANVPISQREQKGLLVLNAVPPPPDLRGKLPNAEARSLFAVVPGEATVIADPSAGGGGSPTSAAGSGSHADLSSGDAVAQSAGGGKEGGRPSGSSGSGSGGKYGTGQGSGLNTAGNAGGSGRGAESGSGVGTGSSGTLASGTGTGSAPGGGSFPGISIQGGRYGNGGGGSVGASMVRHPRSYNMTIVSTASSGGGLPDLGVFQNEKVYTVYLDMKANDDDPALPWTLQYAVLQTKAENPDDTTNPSRETPTPPYALLKEIPKFAPELLRQYARRLIVASAIMTAAGKLEQIVVRQSPSGEFSGPIVEALGSWMFQPAQIEGKSVALKVLFGIRLVPGR